MTFPTIPTVAEGRVLFTNQANTSGTRTFPNLSSLTKNSGDLLIAIIFTYQSTTNPQFTSWGGGFTEFGDQGTSTTLGLGCAYKWSTGSETGTFTVTQATTITGHASMCLLSIPLAHPTTVPECGTIANGTSAAADPASFNPAGWGTEDTLWISVVGSGMTSGTGSWTATGTTAPTNYTSRADSNTTDSSTIGQTEIAVSFRQLNAASEDIGTAGVDTSNARNSACIIAIRPDNSVSVAISTVAGTGNVGSVVAAIATTISGNAGTGAVGSVGTTTGYSAALTGNAGTGSVGSFVPSLSLALSGNAGTGAVQTIVPLISAAISGFAGTGAIGNLSPAISSPLSNVVGTGSVGSFTPSIILTLSGNAGVGGLGSLVAVISTAISGNVALSDVGTLIPSSSGGGGPVVTAFNRSSMAGGVTQHQGISRPSLIGQDASTKQYKQHDFKPDGVNRETYLIDGELP